MFVQASAIQSRDMLWHKPDFCFFFVKKKKDVMNSSHLFKAQLVRQAQAWG